MIEMNEIESQHVRLPGEKILNGYTELFSEKFPVMQWKSTVSSTMTITITVQNCEKEVTLLCDDTTPWMADWSLAGNISGPDRLSIDVYLIVPFYH